MAHSRIANDPTLFCGATSARPAIGVIRLLVGVLLAAAVMVLLVRVDPDVGGASAKPVSAIGTRGHHASA